MSLYNAIHGFNPMAPMVLAMLGIDQGSIPRFRDAYFNGEYLCVHTRTGGGNREYYDGLNDENKDGPWNSGLRDVAGYVTDEDDEYDSTYATFFFEVPTQFAWFKDWAADKVARPPAERWQEAIEKIRTAPADDPTVQRLSLTLQPIVEWLAKGPTA